MVFGDNLLKEFKYDVVDGYVESCLSLLFLIRNLESKNCFIDKEEFLKFPEILLKAIKYNKDRWIITKKLKLNVEKNHKSVDINLKGFSLKKTNQFNK